MTRIPYVNPNDLSAQARELHDATRTPEVIGVLANAQDSFLPWFSAVTAIRESPDLDPVLRELIILRTASRVGCEYELIQHRAIALQAGVTPSDVEAACADGIPEGVNGTILSLVDDLFQGRGVDDERVRQALGVLSSRALVEAIMIAGVYVTIGRLVEAAALNP